MAILKLLHDLYRFSGFVPLATIRGIFGDSRAVVITLRRRQKKRSVASADRCTMAITTNGHEGFAIFPVATNESIFSWPCDESGAHGARP
jgi:hypothetical protein